MTQDPKDYVLQRAQEHNIRIIQLWFTDILGFLKSFSITVEELEDALKDGEVFDGSSIEGFIRHSEQDMIAMPDPSTFQILPWRSDSKNSAVGSMFCDILDPDGTRSYELSLIHI